MRKVVIIGSGGAGKSTLAQALGALLAVEVIHLDLYFWRPGWVETPAEQWREVVKGLVARDAWVMDGNYSGTMDIRLPAADTIIFMDIPRWRCLWRVMIRLIRYRGKSRPDLPQGCPEQLDWAFLKWIWQFPKTHRPTLAKLFAAHAVGRTIVIIRSPHDVDTLFAALRLGQPVPESLRFIR